MRTLHSPEQAAQWLRERVTGCLRTDSRAVGAGDGFVAWPGAALDARQFVAKALEQGASACLMEATGVEAFSSDSQALAAFPGLKSGCGAIADAYYGHPSQSLDVWAVTGTNGKTSTAWWLAQARNALGGPGAAPTCGLMGTLGVGVPATGEDALSTMVGTGLTTPDPVRLQHELRRFADQGLSACAMEASSIGIAEHRLEGVRVHTALFTNFTQDHLDYHGDMANYWRAKAALFAWPGLRAAVVNVDDAQGAVLHEGLNADALDLWSVGTLASARLRVVDVQVDGARLRLTVAEGAARCGVHTPTLGHYNALNLLGVLACLRAQGVALDQAVHCCAGLGPVPGRMQTLALADQPLVVVDYAHTPDALDKVLRALQAVARQRGGRLWCLFGCGGDRDASKRPMMAAVAERGADQVVITSDNPRSERAQTIISQILLGLSHERVAQVQSDRALAIAQTLGAATPRDVVLLAGKGHESTQEIAGVKLPFSDLAHARAALAARGGAA